MYVFDREPPAGAILRDIDRLRSVADDLERAHAGNHPGKRVVSDAPVIEDWQIAYRQEICLVGKVTGHPVIGNGRLAFTSGLWLLSRELGYARTMSRFYALGRPAATPYRLSK